MRPAALSTARASTVTHSLHAVGLAPPQSTESVRVPGLADTLYHWRSAALPEGRVIRLRIPIAIPSSIEPLPMKKSFGEVIRALVRNSQLLKEIQGVALL